MHHRLNECRHRDPCRTAGISRTDCGSRLRGLVPLLFAEARRQEWNANSSAIKPSAVPTMPRTNPMLSVVDVLLAAV
jgi:hypothetical protein